MSLDIENPTRERRPYGFVLFGIGLLVVAGFVANDARRRNTTPIEAPSAYEFTINQSSKTEVTYLKNSFFDDGPGSDNSAYIAELTDKMKTSFSYDFTANKETELTSTYFVKALVSNKYILGADVKDISNVWTKEYPLIKPVVKTTTTKNIHISPSVEIPFSDYRQEVDRLKKSLSLPVSSQVDIVFSVQVSGESEGASISDVRVSTVTAPLDQPIYKLATTFDKNVTKQVTSPKLQQNEDNMRKYELIASAALTVLGLASIVYGFRKQIFKSAYQRELDRIYSYHDGIIIKAHKAASHEGLRVVPVQSFDDMLNLEEEIKEPIVASPAGGEATRFSIVRGDVIYVYTLGKALIDEDSFDDLGNPTTRNKSRHLPKK